VPGTQSARAIAKQHAGSAVFEIKDAAEYLAADDESAFGRTSFDHRICHGERIDEAAAHGLHVECGAACNAFRRY
jgi:hypothetical protein